jgi:S1-C subfamily serine protease
MLKRVVRSSVLGFACICFYVAGTMQKPRPAPAPFNPGTAVMRLLGAQGGGTGFQVQVGNKHYVVTNDHVCGLADKDNLIMAVPTYGRVTILRILSRSQTTDLCLLTPVSGLPGLKLGTKDGSYMESVAVYGHPHLDKLTRSVGKVGRQFPIDILEYVIDSPETLASCTGKKHTIQDIYFGLMQGCMVRVPSQETSVPIAPGNSGSPALNKAGRVIGVVFAASSGGIPSYIIPFHDLKGFLDEFTQTHK